MKKIANRVLKVFSFLILRTLGLFSPHVNSFERRVGRFFRRIRSSTPGPKVKRRLLDLMQENLITVNLWMEKKYKGYRYLTKRTRRRLYENVKILTVEFKKEISDDNSNIDEVKAILLRKGHSFPNGHEEKILYLYKIMRFFKPGKHYRYMKTASFSKLLRDPKKETLEGDCNQIVTLYAYFYSLRYPLDDLKIKLLPEHVCLHFRGIDIEATNATFQKFKEDYKILPITEIISTNLLDIADFREKVRQISPRDMVKSSQLAYAISSLRELVTKNLNIAYRNLAIAAMKSKDFKTAIFYFSKIGDRNAIQTARRNEGVHYYKNNRLEKAIGIFRSLNDREMERACYAKQYNNLARKVSSVKTMDDARRHKSTYRKMLDLAVKMGDSRLQSSLRQTLNKL